MALIHRFLISLEMPQYFPQPAGPNNNYEYIFESFIPENRYPLLEDVDAKVHDSLKKLFSMVGNYFPLERSIREEVQDYRDNATMNMVKKPHGELNHGALDDFINTQRDVDIDSIDRSMGEGVKRKMERFKVRTINLGGVAKEEDQK